MREQQGPQVSIGVLAVAPAEAARLTGVGRTTIYEEIGKGTLTSVKIGKRRLITIEALRAWLLAHEVAAEHVSSHASAQRAQNREQVDGPLSGEHRTQLPSPTRLLTKRPQATPLPSFEPTAGARSTHTRRKTA